MKDYIKDIDQQAERRFFDVPVSLRAEQTDDGIIEGVAAVVDSWTDMGWFEERISKGAFDDRLQDDIAALFNHDVNQVLARSTNGRGTLSLFIDQAGNLGYRYKTPDRTYARDLLDAIKSGDVAKSSFAFRSSQVMWEDASEEKGIKKDRRTIVKFERLYDVSPVTFPAYQDTSVAARSLEIQKERDYRSLLLPYQKKIFIQNSIIKP